MQIFQLLLSDPAQGLIYLLSLFLAMCIAISFHECAHAFMAYKLGDPTAKNLGKLSLDPLRHIDWLGFASFLLFGLGWAKPVLVNSKNLKHFRRDDALISLAGPLVNLLLAFGFYGIAFFVTYAGVQNDVILEVLSVICTLNLNFAIFNILPLPGLDGYHIVTSLFVRKSNQFLEFLNRYSTLILFALMWSGVFTLFTTWAGNGIIDLFQSFFLLFV